jgi:small subunit ribosomal protein S16
MLRIRFLRVGKKNQPSFKIVVINTKRAPQSGKFIEEVGFYNPLTKEVVLKKERILYWLSKGVKTSAVVHNLLVSKRIIEGSKIPLFSPKKKEVKKEEGQEEKPKEKELKEEKEESSNKEKEGEELEKEKGSEKEKEEKKQEDKEKKEKEGPDKKEEKFTNNP